MQNMESEIQILLQELQAEVHFCVMIHGASHQNFQARMFCYSAGLEQGLWKAAPSQK